MAGSDLFLISEQKLFKNMKDCLSLKEEKKTKNLIDFKDNVLFAWKSDESKLLVEHIKSRDKSSFFQQLFPNEPPLFEVSYVTANSTLSKVVLWGSDGVCVMDLPRRWGINSAFQGGKDTVLTRSQTVDAQFFSSKAVEVCRVHFHPGSQKDNHLLVLTSMNTLRLYISHVDDKIHADTIQLVSVWPLGPPPQSSVPLLMGLGDTAVDFDFCPPLLYTHRESEEKEMLKEDDVVWPIILLRGNGDVYHMSTQLNVKSKPKMFGPLSMYPPADDNYGVDACSVLVLQTLPNIIVIATCSGTLHHFVMLASHDEEKSEWEMEPKNALYLLESIELELGLQLQDDDTATYTCPLHLHQDPVTKSRYFCTHNTGMHSISVPFVNQLDNYIDSTGELFNSHPTSFVEYLICTRTNSSPLSPVLGLTVLTSPTVLLVLLSSGDVVDLQLKMVDVVHEFGGFLNEDDDFNEDASPIKKLLKEPFDLHIKRLLKKSFNQPILKLDKNSQLTPKECLDLVNATVSSLRNEYFVKYDRVYDEIERRITTLTALKLVQLRDLEELDVKKQLCKNNAECLAEKYEEIKDHQSTLAKRVERLLVKVLERDPVESVAEKKMKNQLLLVRDKMESYRKTISDVKEKSDYQKFKIDGYDHKRDQQVSLGDNQIETIKSTLKQTSEEILTIVNSVNLLKKQMESFDK